MDEYLEAQFKEMNSLARFYLEYSFKHDRILSQYCSYEATQYGVDSSLKLFNSDPERGIRFFEFRIKQAIRKVKGLFGDYNVLIDKFEKQVMEECGLNPIENKNWFMVTVNYPSDYDATKLEDNVKKLATVSSIDSIVEHSHEFFTETGGHPHTHMVIKTKLPKTKVIQYFSQKLKLKKENIDVRGPKDGTRTIQTSLDYVNGFKKASKLDNVEKDKKFRLDNGL